MSRVRLYIWLPLFMLLSCLRLSAQGTNLLQKIISIEFPENTFLGHVDNLLIQEDIVLAFNSSRVKLDEVIKLPKGEQQLGYIIKSLFYSHNVKATIIENKVIITFLDKQIEQKLTIKGTIRDKETGEVLVGASIVELSSNSSTFSNESGFFSLTVPLEKNSINFHYLGYKSLLVNDIKESSQNILLQFDNEIDPIVIEGSVSDKFLLGSGSEKIDLSLTKGFQTTSGDNDLIRAVRISPKVQSGNEGQVGLYVRGGSPDQNLILFDGIPLYEVSHIAGFSSIFIEESIKDVDFITDGFPARYGGRLSSVMNVRLKEGNQSGLHGSINASLPAVKAHFEGPLFNFTDKTTFNISGRVSYAQSYLNQLVGDFIAYDNIDLGYHDIVGKVTHRFSPTQKLSLSFYDGRDSLGLTRSNETIDDEQNIFERSSNNRIDWGSRVWNAKFTNILTDKLQLAFNVGGIKYTNNSNAQFEINSIIDSLGRKQELELISHSQIEDQLVGINLDYYVNDQHRIKLGGSWIHHEYSPSLYGNDTIQIGDRTQFINEINLVIADELALFIEDTYRPHENWQIYGGLHFSGYNYDLQQYRNTQPRFSTVFTPNSKNRFTVSYSSMVQYVHLLVNAGLGLPSDLWVPSTNNVSPETAQQFSFAYSRKIKKSVELSFSGYTKNMNNLLEYNTPTDLFVTVGSSVDPPIIHTDPNWENTVTSGSSKSYGLEFQVRRTAGTFTGWLSYALSRTTRLFESINMGEEFPFKYDRRHDINAGIQYKINKKCSLSANWVYGTGNAYSLAVEEIKPPWKGFPPIPTGGDRNNYRFPAFSHLDIQFNYEKQVGKCLFKFNLGVYNAYNRKNAYYVYLYENPDNSSTDGIKVSLFPILPNMSLGCSF